jgi:DNA-binding sugar fermentation-stimulating protein
VRYAEPLVRGALLAHYQRFLADVRLSGNGVVQVRVPNAGRMTGCAAPGSPWPVAPACGARRRLASLYTPFR